MAIKHNQKIISHHFHKDWQRRVRCHFNQPGKKIRRRNARKAKAAAIAPRPVDLLRPVVRCPTIKYNRRVRAGRGFTLAELKAASIPRRYARTIGIAVDPRRQNLSEESLTANVERLKAYMARLIIFPTKKAQKKGASAEMPADPIASTKTAYPIASLAPSVSEISKSDMPEAAENGAYRTLRLERSDARYKGARDKRAREKAEAADAKK